jgi:hypothetical protein
MASASLSHHGFGFAQPPWLRLRSAFEFFSRKGDLDMKIDLFSTPIDKNLNVE